MRQLFLLLAVLLSAATPAFAQVTIDLHALDALPGVKPPAPNRPPAVHRAPPRQSPRPQAATEPKPSASPPGTPARSETATAPTTAPASGAQATAGQVAPPPANAPPPPAATLPTEAPPTVALAPIAPAPPSADAAPPPPPPVSDTATSTATTITNGLRVTFGADQSDLSAATADAIQVIARGALGNAASSVNVVAYASETPDDPSIARRLSLARALAVRGALIADGINSSRIYVRALGSTQGIGDGPQDRVDLTVMGTNAPGQAPATTPASTPAPPAPPASRQQ